MVFFDSSQLFEDLKSLELVPVKILGCCTLILEYYSPFFLTLQYLFFLSLYLLAARNFHKMILVVLDFDYFPLSCRSV
jgi:hypothetical protein